MDIDFLLAAAHHLVIFILIMLLAAEFALIGPGLSGPRIRKLAWIDATYGGTAAAVLLIGILRVLFHSKGWEYYAGNYAFWAKMIAFGIAALISIRPTIAIRRWAAKLNATGSFAPTASELADNRRLIMFQAIGLGLMALFASAMARGYGSF